MTSKERYLNLLDGQPVDFIPRVPILMRYAAEYIGSNYGAFTADHRVLVAANVRCAADFGFDQLNTMSDPLRETEGFGGKVAYDATTGVHLIEPLMPDEIDLSLLVTHPDPLKATRMRDRIDAVADYHRTHGDTHSIMGWVEGAAAEAADIRGAENFFADLLTEPEAIDGLMDLCLENAINFARIQIDQGADTIGIGDAVASQVSFDTYARHILPREQKLVAALHAAGVKVRLHICGNITHILPGLATLGIDVIDIDHMVDLRAAREALGPRVVLSANLDPVADILRGTPASIRQRLEAARAQAGPAFIVNAGCEIPSGTPPENLRALCEPLAIKS
ncbi:MAG: uroporphyrinogen decarboxylase family protein [Verrucomicrobiales bacterium]|jgi:MtaA/CmuA family methyltransferase|nr:uroporphyrinogen decarboxylase family protein [Verrucomicrobiales bacterium]